MRRGMITAPVKFQRKFRYTSAATRALGAGAAVTNVAALFNCNSLFQIDQVATGPEFLPGLTEFGSLYNRARVNAFKVKLEYAPSAQFGTFDPNYDNFQIFWLTIPEGNNLPSGTPAQKWTTYQSWLSNNPKHCMSAMCTAMSTAGRWRTMKKYFRCIDFVPEPKAWATDDDFVNHIAVNGVFGPNPVRLIQGQVGMLSMTSAGFVSACTVTLRIGFTFYVEFDQVRIQGN